MCTTPKIKVLKLASKLGKAIAGRHDFLATKTVFEGLNFVAHHRSKNDRMAFE
jgi:hypothetical protein